MEFGVWGVVAAGALLATGVVLGLLLSGGLGAAERLRRLERELAEERERHASYRDGVAKHFVATSDRFRTLTREYTALGGRAQMASPFRYD